MAKMQQGKSLRAIAREWGTSPSYASQFFAKHCIRPLADGTYDGMEATRLREKHTRAGQGRAHLHPSSAVTVCAQCGAKYVPAECAKDPVFAAKDKNRFCSQWCQQDAEGGVTPAATVARVKRQHLEGGGSRSDFKDPDRWLNYWTQAAQ